MNATARRNNTDRVNQLLKSATFALGILVTPIVLQAQSVPALFGMLSNFDCLNDTGHETEGFEIELDGISSSDITYTFGGTYIRYGTPTIVPFMGGVYVRYISAWNPATQKFATATPIATNFSPTNGHLCWSGANPTGYLASGCEHFGVGTRINPTATHYRWLVADPLHPGSVKPFGKDVSIPAPTWTVVPPVVVGNPPAVVAEINPPEPRSQQYGEALWVKIFKTELARPVALVELLSDNPVVPKDAAEVEIGWEIAQASPNKVNNGALDNQAAPGANAQAVIRRYEFYKYTGVYDPESHEVMCADPGGSCNVPQPGELGDYIGAQMAAALLGLPAAQAKLTVTKAGTGTVAGGAINCGAVCSTSVDVGTTITLTATPSVNYAFSAWSGACGGAVPTCTVAMDTAKSVKATFVALPPKLTVTKTGVGTVVSAPAGINCGVLCSVRFALASTVKLTATPAAGYMFAGWSGACTGLTTTCAVIMSQSRNATALFK